MATISSTLKINDAFSNTLNKFNAGVQRSVGLGNRLKNAMNSSGNSMFTLRNGASSAGVGLKQIIAGSAFGGMISSAASAATAGIRSMVGELNEASVSWQTFDGNMRQLGRSPAQIAAAKSAMQKFAQDTIYSASDMSSTYSQLAAVGVKDTTRLVKGFGGLAAAATDPKQAMKTLSQQATQMAAKPTVQWQDFKLMLEQTPAGMAAVAKSMHMSTQDLVKNVQAGTIKTQEFLNAVAKTGTNANFSKMATQYKTVGQALDGLKETLANGLQPQFQKLSKIGINAIEGITDSLGSLNWNAFGDGIVNAISYVKPIIDKFKLGLQDIFDGFKSSGAGSEIGKMFQTIADAASNLTDTMSTGTGGTSFFTMLGSISGKAIAGLAKAISAIATVIGKLSPGSLKALGAAFLILKTGTKGLVFTAVVAGLNKLSELKPGTLNNIAGAVKNLAIAFAAFKVIGTVGKGLSSIFGLFKGLKSLKTPKMQTPDVPQAGGITQSAGAFLKLGAALMAVGVSVVLVASGFWILAQAATSLASGGGAAIAVFFGMIVAIGALAVVVKLLGTAFIGGAAGFLIFGAALLVIGAAIFIATAGLALLGMQLPNIASYGAQAALSILLLAGAIAVFGIAAIVGAVGVIALALAVVVLGVAMIVGTVGAALLGAGLLILGIFAIVAAVGVMLLSVGVALLAAFSLVAAVGLILMGVGITLVAAVAMIAAVGMMFFAVALAVATPLILVAAVGVLLLGVAAIILGAGLMVVGAALIMVAAGMVAAGAAAMMMVAMFIMAGTMLVAAITGAMQNVVSAVRNGVQNAVNAARSFGSALVSVGKDLIQGLISGITSMIGAAVNAVSNVAGKVVSAAKSFFHIGSPSKLFNQYGRWLDQGLAIGLNHDADVAASASASMAAGVVAAASDMTPTLNPLAISKSNAGDMLANGFNRAYDAITQVGGALSSLNGASAGIGIAETDQIDTSYSGDDDSLNSLIGAKFGGFSSKSDDHSATVTIENGAIQINSTGNVDYDADMLLAKLEDRLIALNEKSLT